MDADVTRSSRGLDNLAMFANIAFWIHHVQGEKNIDFEPDAALAVQRTLLGERDGKPSKLEVLGADLAFTLGFGAALRLASAVSTGPLGGADNAVEAALAKIEEQFRSFYDGFNGERIWKRIQDADSTGLEDIAEAYVRNGKPSKRSAA